MNEHQRRIANAQRQRYVQYFDPQVCPTCFSPASVPFGARLYCPACAAAMRGYLDSVSLVPILRRPRRRREAAR